MAKKKNLIVFGLVRIFINNSFASPESIYVVRERYGDKVLKNARTFEG